MAPDFLPAPSEETNGGVETVDYSYNYWFGAPYYIIMGLGEDCGGHSEGVGFALGGIIRC